jgi:peptidoglycan/LPS O-acetylase OafA/YrhL
MRELAQHTSKAPGQQTRDGYLDSLKALALTRMVLWHTYAWPPLSFVIAAMPAMFFASGALAYQSLGRTRPTTFLLDRIVRLLVPLWVYTVVCYVVMAALGYSPSLADLPNWILPIWDPAGPTAASALWIPLWYLRAYLWLVLLAPVLVAAYRRAPITTLVVIVTGFVTTELWNAYLTSVPFQFRDLAFYGTFFVVGFTYFDVVRQQRRSRLVLTGGAAALAALGAYLLTPPAQGIANASYTVHFFVGVGWLAVLLAAAGWLANPGWRRRGRCCVRAR